MYRDEKIMIDADLADFVKQNIRNESDINSVNVGKMF